MENIKVSVKHNDWSEVFDMLVELGAKHKTVKSEYGDNFGWLFVHEDVIWIDLFPHNKKECREVVFRELKDMVVLNRNDVEDATHKSGNHKYYLTGSEFYKYSNNEWVNVDEFVDGMSFELIEKKEMKEFLVKNDFVESIWERNESENMKEFLVKHDDKWTLQLLDSDTEENSYRVAVPSEAELAIYHFGDLNHVSFYTSKCGVLFVKSPKVKEWTKTQYKSVEDIYHFTNNESKLLWQRSGDFTKVTIDGVEAFNAIANGITVQYRFAGGEWKDYTQDLNHDSSKLKAVTFLCGHCEFRYKPKTIIVNGVEYEDEQQAVKVVKDYFKGYIKC